MGMWMRKRLFWPGVIVIVLAAASVLSACGDAPGLPGSAPGLNPSPQLTLEQAERVARSFLDAWKARDYGAMYSLISPNSQSAYTQEEFTSRYTEAADMLTLASVETQLVSSLRQGTTAAIMYDATFQSNQFGKIEDLGRTLRVLETPEGWRVAWSSMDIFPELVEGARLDLERTMPNRGNIYDRDGEVLVAQDGTSILLWVVRQDLVNEGDCITLLSRILLREYGDIEEQFARFAPETRFFAGEIDPETYRTEEQSLLQLCDIGDDNGDTSTRTTRRYVEDLAPHLIGYIGQIQTAQVDEYAAKGYPPDALVGQEGIEKAYEDELKGTIGARLRIVSPTGEVLRTIAEIPPAPGKSIYLTIDRELQAGVQNAFKESYDYAQPTWAPTSPGAAAVVMEVKTGKILAMASWPSYTPGLFSPDSPVWDRVTEIQRVESDWRTPLLNRATQGLYPLGSVFKIVSVATGIDSGVYDPERTTNCTGVWSHPDDGGSPRTDWKPDGHGPGINAHWGLTYSCNPYFWDLGTALHQVDPNLLADYAHMMGLGVPTGQTALVEDTGYIPNPDGFFRRNAQQWSLGETLNLVIGQGQMQVTPLQVVRMIASIASDGQVWVPQMVDRIQLIGEQPTYVAEPTVTNTLDFDQSTFDIIKEAMCDVTMNPNGTARFIFQPWYEYQGEDVIICGKTGTAQAGGAGVDPQAWFGAFAPKDDPEIAVVVVVENSCEGSEVAAPIVRRIVEEYYNMPTSELPPLWKDHCTDLGGQ